MKQIDVAVLGLGHMGEIHVNAAKDAPNVRKIYAYEPDAKRAEERGKLLGVLATSDLQSIYDNPEIKLVYIASSNDAHCELAVKSMRAGKAVMCEKPMGVSLEEAELMNAVQKETGQFLQIGFELHYSKLYQIAKDWIDQGLIGDPVNCHCRYYCSEFHRKNTWRSNSSGHALIGEKLSHYIDLQRWFLNSEPKEIYAMVAPNAVDYFKHPDNHQISTRFENGTIAHLNFVMHIAESDANDPLLEMLEKQSDDGHSLQYHIMGTKGAIQTDVFRRRIRRWEFTDLPDRMNSEIVETISYKAEQDREWMHNVHGQNIRIAELVANGLPPENPASDSLATMKMGFAAERSGQEERAVKLSEFN